MKPTIYDIAQKAGVSATTVSKVLNNKGRISEQTKFKILKIIEEIQYQPNMIASAMKGKQTYTIGLVIPNLYNPVYSEYIRILGEYGHELGFCFVVCSTNSDPEKEAKQISLLCQRQVDGVIIASKFKNDEVLRDLLEGEIPTILFAQEKEDIRIDCVTLDDFLGGFLVTKYLISLGHQRIAVIKEDGISSEERVRGYKKALQEANIKVEDHYIRLSNTTIDAAAIVGRELLDLDEKPTAVFGCNDMIAVGVIIAAKQREMIVPKDLSVIGFDDTLLCKITEPPLTSVSIPLKVMGRKAMDLLIQSIKKNDHVKQRVTIFPEIVVRGTTTMMG